MSKIQALKMKKYRPIMKKILIKGKGKTGDNSGGRKETSTAGEANAPVRRSSLKEKSMAREGSPDLLSYRGEEKMESNRFLSNDTKSRRGGD